MALTLEEFSDNVLAGLRGGEGLASFPKCVKERTCVEEVRLFDGVLRAVLVKLAFSDSGFFNLDEYCRALILAKE